MPSIEPAAAQRVADLVPVVLDLEREGAGELEARDRAMRLVQAARSQRGMREFADLGTCTCKPGDRILGQRTCRRLELVPDVAPAQRDMRRARKFLHRLRRNAEQHVAIERDVGDRARQDAERVERARRFHHAVHAVLAPGRTIAEHAAERCRPDGRAGGLRADRDRHHEIGHCRGRAARRGPQVSG